jgi:hypothetical protein
LQIFDLDAFCFVRYATLIFESDPVTSLRRVLQDNSGAALQAISAAAAVALRQLPFTGCAGAFHV